MPRVFLYTGFIKFGQAVQGFKKWLGLLRLVERSLRCQQ